MTFLQAPDANVHIAAIVFFDMLADRVCNLHNITVKTQNRVGEMAKVSLEKDKIKFLLVEGVHQKAVESLRAAGYNNIEFHKGALDSEQLKESIRDAHFIGLRSRTQLTEDVIAAAEKLVAIGCFCIGT